MGLSNGETRRQASDGGIVRDCRGCLGTGRYKATLRFTGDRVEFVCGACGGTGQLILRAPDLDPWGKRP